jgi:cytidine deaminase
MSDEKQAVPANVWPFVPFGRLCEDEQRLITQTLKAANNAYVPLSGFPVGCALLAKKDGVKKPKMFSGCNVENGFPNPTICGETNTVTTAVAAGYRNLQIVALGFKKYWGPGASPCGRCRQVLMEFGPDAVMIHRASRRLGVRRYHVCDLLPAATGQAKPFEKLDPVRSSVVQQLDGLLPRTYSPYLKRNHAAVFIASNVQGETQRFDAMDIENASYGVSAGAEVVAMHSAKAAGFDREVTLAVSVKDPCARNPIEGIALQTLREFGLGTKVWLVGPKGSLVESTIDELFPDGFGPQAVAETVGL